MGNLRAYNDLDELIAAITMTNSSAIVTGMSKQRILGRFSLATLSLPLRELSPHPLRVGALNLLVDGQCFFRQLHCFLSLV